MDKERLDQIVANKTGLSRVMAKDAIINGQVLLNGTVLTQPGKRYDTQSPFTFHLPETVYVSRGGFKLEKAIEQYSVMVKDKVCIDVGASTGGFTHCLLKNGAKEVYAVDTGTNQLADSLKNDCRVRSMENTNVNDLVQIKEILPRFDIAVIDVSFVSVKKIIRAVYTLLAEQGTVICLIKPQFEAGIKYLNKKGIVKNNKVHISILMDQYDTMVHVGFHVLGVTPSPLKGGDGNREYLLYMEKSTQKQSILRSSFQLLAEQEVKLI